MAEIVHRKSVDHDQGLACFTSLKGTCTSKDKFWNGSGILVLAADVQSGNSSLEHLGHIGNPCRIKVFRLNGRNRPCKVTLLGCSIPDHYHFIQVHQALGQDNIQFIPIRNFNLLRNIANI